MKHYSKEFKEEALKLSDEIGVKKAAQQLGIAYYTLADWRSIRRNTPPAKTLSAEEQSIRIRELERENAELFRFWVFPDCTFLDISKNPCNQKGCRDFCLSAFPVFRRPFRMVTPRTCECKNSQSI